MNINNIKITSFYYKKLLNYNFSCHGARIKFIPLFIQAIFQVKSINQVQIATSFSSNAQVSSNYKPLPRLFPHFDIDTREFLETVIAIMNCSQKWVLSNY